MRITLNRYLTCTMITTATNITKLIKFLPVSMAFLLLLLLLWDVVGPLLRLWLNHPSFLSLHIKYLYFVAYPTRKYEWIGEKIIFIFEASRRGCLGRLNVTYFRSYCSYSQVNLSSSTRGGSACRCVAYMYMYIYENSIQRNLCSTQLYF